MSAEPLWPYCRKCGEPFAASQHLTATVNRDPDGQIVADQAYLYHTDCWVPEQHPGEIAFLRGYPSRIDPSA
jgi:hypothetical protein